MKANTKKIYFASDFHLGWPSYEKSLIREKLIVKWLDEIKQDAAAIYLLGDIFDFWHEWRHAAPQGFVRFLGKIAEITDRGIEVHLFTGNHDIWIYEYLPKELNVILHRKEFETTILGKKFYLAHGDGLGPWDKKYKLLKWIFTNKVLQYFFAKIHPDWALGLGQTWSRSRRVTETEYEFKGIAKEWLIQYSKMILQKKPIDFFAYGHRHIPMYYQLSEQSTFINLGEWLINFSYGEFDGENFTLKSYKYPERDFTILD